ncbi:two-component sensor histidine kinase [Pseudonocardia sp. KRD-184]|uniref:histidine kinase n=1 Tax=Pseudonocardia oceani TaxID=2792013 RepID=A0ABS6U8P4_9PSEU|nr:histidine kinase [Pseudonocardia oceani]MBW0091175.1 two-component sensor histidine kinase [Pseudonocardia oceani]MBW0098254.1 two-component sensor histidine kinase [Pseudonocardia oceani]MBW0110853.1 two-component sensor histidine kinase [Pseudonocardia oceani]MBW0122846.1 two-component sensor histidine kinase [Pseudonocardia oceani]MBW0128264.1 two-component sensor histidine kinase [Pseudonocardia oceani]
MTARERFEDVLRAVAFLVVGVILYAVLPDGVIRWRPDLPEPSTAVALGVLAVSCSGIALRRGHPVLGLLVTVVAMLAGPFAVGVTHTGSLLALGEALYNAVLHSTLRASRWVAACTGVLTALVALRILLVEDAASAVRTVMSLGLLLAIPVFWGLEVRHLHERAEAEHDRAEHERRVAERDRTAAVAAERNRMARDLHDVIAGQLSAIAIQSEAALTVPDADPDVLRRVLAQVRQGSVASLAEMRTLIGLLRAGQDDEERTSPGGLERVGALADVGRATGLTVEVDDRRPPGDLPAAVDLAAYRIVQESLTNAAKHAPGSAVRVVLRHDGDELNVEVANDLVDGAADGGGTGTGLLGLAERAAAVGGRIDAGPRGRSWSVRAVLPAPSPVAVPR